MDIKYFIMKIRIFHDYNIRSYKQGEESQIIHTLTLLH